MGLAVFPGFGGIDDCSGNLPVLVFAGDCLFWGVSVRPLSALSMASVRWYPFLFRYSRTILFKSDAENGPLDLPCCWDWPWLCCCGCWPELAPAALLVRWFFTGCGWCVPFWFWFVLCFCDILIFQVSQLEPGVSRIFSPSLFLPLRLLYCSFCHFVDFIWNLETFLLLNNSSEPVKDDIYSYFYPAKGRIPFNGTSSIRRSLTACSEIFWTIWYADNFHGVARLYNIH